MNENTKSITFEEAKELNLLHMHNIMDCSPSYRGRGIYVIDFGSGIKIGMANNLANRLASYNKPWVREIKNIACFKTPNPLWIEVLIKRTFSRATKGLNSTEFLQCVSFDYIVGFIRRNKFYKYNSRLDPK